MHLKNRMNSFIVSTKIWESTSSTCISDILYVNNVSSSQHYWIKTIFIQLHKLEYNILSIPPSLLGNQSYFLCRLFSYPISYFNVLPHLALCANGIPSVRLIDERGLDSSSHVTRINLKNKMNAQKVWEVCAFQSHLGRGRRKRKTRTCREGYWSPRDAFMKSMLKHLFS